ncbi:MAG: tRNA dihydrouridine synthase [Desulfopila sp.]
MSQTPVLYLAPLRGITDVIYRSVFARHFGGVDLAVAPFLTPQRSPSRKKRILTDLVPEHNQALPVIPQLLNNHAEDFLYLAHQLEDLGYTDINWNLGCPAPMVAKKGRGSGFLPYPDAIIALLDQVIPRLTASLSIKMRLGYQHRSEGCNLLPRLDDYPLREIIIHPRTGKQMYRGSTDLEGFAACQPLSRHRLVYNGDITSPEGFTALAGRFPVIDHWMIGRGILANPLLAEEIKGLAPPAHSRRLDRIRAFHDELLDAYRQRLAGPGHLIGKMKQLWLYLIFSFPGREKPFKKLKRARTEEQLLAAIEQLFEPPADCRPSPLSAAAKRVVGQAKNR